MTENKDIKKNTKEAMHCGVFIFLILLHFSNTSSKCTCDKQSCHTPKDCLHGVVWDHCYCCQVCGKGEGDLCGGKDYIHGECGGVSHLCVVRDNRNYLNRFKDKANELVGRCEPYSCGFEQCPFGQRCAVKNGYTHCDCNISCSGMIKQRVCGVTNNKQYENECELRKEECRIGKRIGVSINPCPGSNIVKVSCKSSSMKLEISREIFGRRRPRGLVLNDPSCKALVNVTHVSVSTLYGGCGTKVKYTLTSIIYSNTLRTLPPRNALIRRGKKVSIPFNCEFVVRNRNRNHVSFSQVKRPISKSFQPGKYTIELKDGSYVEVDKTRNYTIVLKTFRYKGKKVKLVPTFCYATPSEQGYQDRRFVIINEGCPMQSNVAIKSFTDTTIVLQVPGIRFKEIRENGANIRCKVRRCVPNMSPKGTNCEPKCGNTR